MNKINIEQNLSEVDGRVACRIWNYTKQMGRCEGVVWGAASEASESHLVVEAVALVGAVGSVSVSTGSVDGGVGTVGVSDVSGVSGAVGVGTVAVGGGGGLVHRVHVGVGGGDGCDGLDHGGVRVVAVGGCVAAGIAETTQTQTVSVRAVADDSGLSGSDGHHQGDAHLCTKQNLVNRFLICDKSKIIKAKSLTFSDV